MLFRLEPMGRTIAQFSVTEADHSSSVLGRDLQAAEVVVLRDQGGDGAVETPTLDFVGGGVSCRK